MLTGTSERLIQLKRIAVLTDLSQDSEKMVRYAASVARWYGSELLLVHADPPEFYVAMLMETLPNWSGNPVPSKRHGEEALKALSDKLNLHDLSPKLMVREAGIGVVLKELEDYRPSLLVLATHGREGLRKWLAGSVAEEVFREVQWPVLVLGPSCPQGETGPQKQFQRVLYATDLSAVSTRALQYAAAIAHDHEAQLTALHVDSNPRDGFSFDHTMKLQRLEDWLQDQIDGLADTLMGVRCLVDFGDPQRKITEAAAERQADILVLGARGVGAASWPASHFLGGTAYQVICSSPCPVLIVPQLR
jgi:nucleotide-binding universal stress UspA family protein